MDKLIGPFVVEAKVSFTDAEGSVVGSATVGLGAGKVPTLEAIHRAIGQTLRALPDGCRLLDGDAFFNRVLVREKIGRDGNFATPASFNFDVEALTALALAAYPESKAGEELPLDLDGDDEDGVWDEDE